MKIGARLKRTGDFRKFARKSRAATQGANLDKALAQGALLPVRVAKRRAPVDTANLQKSITIGGFEHLTPDRSGIIRRGQALSPPEGPPHHRAVYWGTDVDYARYPERGTSRMSAQPYIRPAFDETRSEVPRVIGTALQQLIRASI